MEQLIQWDIDLFFWINQANGPVWDAIMAFVSNKWVWIPVYVLLAILLQKLLGWKKWAFCLLMVGLVITLTDRTTSGVLKPGVARYRPCRVEAGLEKPVHLVNNKCGGKYGFASSHAANFWGLATFLSLVFRNRWFTLTSCLCATWVAYSRIYLGVHYPGDVVAGAAIGIIAGGCVYILYRSISNRYFPNPQ
ncbi:MAG: phosphatase PAP2 family protein [Bacteroidota bacterium]